MLTVFQKTNHVETTFQKCVMGVRYTQDTAVNTIYLILSEVFCNASHF